MKILVITIWLTCFGLVNVFAKNLVDRLNPMQSGILNTLQDVLLAPRFYLIFVLYSSCAVLYFIALRIMPLSVAGPVFTILGAMTTSILGVWILGESLSSLKIVGIGLCILGIGLILWQS
jgi:multidrug transporter EmrE-like cation transporter